MHLFVDVSALLRRLQVSLDLAELGQVEGGDLLGLLDLLLVALHLVLQLVNQLLHPLVVLQGRVSDMKKAKSICHTLWSSS